MRSEKRNRFLVMLIAFALLALVPVSYIRIQIAGRQLTPRDLATLADYNNAYLDRTGRVIVDNDTPLPDVFGNLFGFDGQIADALSATYNNREGVATFNRLAGIRGLREKKGWQLETTLLPVESQEVLAAAFEGYNGAVFAYNYLTGEVYTALSLPSCASYSSSLPDGALYNKVLKGTFTPGSTMKVVAMLCAMEQIDPYAMTFNCDGVTETPDGNRVVCSYPHGNGLTVEDAIGLSCNGFITQMAGQLDVSKACESLGFMGFDTQKAQVEQQYISAIPRSSSSTVFANTGRFADRWGMAGQGETVVSCVDMAMIAGAIANGGTAAEPYVVCRAVNLDTGRVTDEAVTLQRQLASQGAACSAKQCWSNACEKYYSLSCKAISYAKTGTAQFDNGTTSRSFLGVMEQYDTAFFVYVEGLRSGDDRCARIAGVLAEELGKIN